MSLTINSVLLAVGEHDKQLFTIPSEFFYPLVIHRSIDEAREKESGERHRFSGKVVVSHLLTGGQLAVWPSYKNALAVAVELEDEEIFLMPTIDLLTAHPDWDRVSVKVRELKALYSVRWI